MSVNFISLGYLETQRQLYAFRSFQSIVFLFFTYFCYNFYFWPAFCLLQTIEAIEMNKWEDKQKSSLQPPKNMERDKIITKHVWKLQFFCSRIKLLDSCFTWEKLSKVFRTKLGWFYLGVVWGSEKVYSNKQFRRIEQLVSRHQGN